jgi:glycosyltransferase involved in cell wall biosynthesis
MGNSEISIIIPAYNEVNRIEPVLSNYCRQFPDQEIIVVCNGCNDGTPELVEKMSLQHSQIKLEHFEGKIGKGAAIVWGFKAARGKNIGFVDADESVNPQEVAAMFADLTKADGIIASRRMKNSLILVRQPLVRRAASKTFNLLVRLIFQLGIKDTQCGAKVFKREALFSVLDDLNTRGFEFDVELLWKLKRRGYKLMEFPITWKHSEESRFSLSKAPGMFYSLLKVRLWS